MMFKSYIKIYPTESILFRKDQTDPVNPNLLGA